MTTALAAVAVATAVVLLDDRAESRARRSAYPGPLRCGAAATSPSTGEHREKPLAAAAGVAVALVVGGASGLMAGVLAAATAFMLLRRSRIGSRAHDEAEMLRALPMAADLLAACVAAGAPPVDALAEVAGSTDGPLGDALAGVVRSMTLGLPAEEAWAHLAAGPPELRTLAAALVRSSISGASPGPVVEALAADLRERQRLTGEAAARRAGVTMVAPLGLCFLPAFVLVGVVPLVAGLVRSGLAAVG